MRRPDNAASSSRATRSICSPTPAPSARSHQNWPIRAPHACVGRERGAGGQSLQSGRRVVMGGDQTGVPEADMWVFQQSLNHPGKRVEAEGRQRGILCQRGEGHPSLRRQRPELRLISVAVLASGHFSRRIGRGSHIGLAGIGWFPGGHRVSGHSRGASRSEQNSKTVLQLGLRWHGERRPARRRVMQAGWEKVIRKAYPILASDVCRRRLLSYVPSTFTR